MDGQAAAVTPPAPPLNQILNSIPECQLEPLSRTVCSEYGESCFEAVVIFSQSFTDQFIFQDGHDGNASKLGDGAGWEWDLEGETRWAVHTQTYNTLKNQSLSVVQRSFSG